MYPSESYSPLGEPTTQPSKDHFCQSNWGPIGSTYYKDLFRGRPCEGQCNSSRGLFEKYRKLLLTFIYLYVAVLVSLYLTYLVYAHSVRPIRLAGNNQVQSSEQQAQQILPEHDIRKVLPVKVRALTDSALDEPELETGAASGQLRMQRNSLEEFEAKIQLLERYIEVVAIDLRETKARLTERERCDCPVKCSFNGSRYADQSTWRSKCDTCKCNSGKISCSPLKCPFIDCDGKLIQEKGQCCPVCMRKCSYYNEFIQHGDKLRPRERNVTKIKENSIKECRCHNGTIFCNSYKLNQPIRLLALSARNEVGDKNSTN